MQGYQIVITSDGTNSVSEDKENSNTTIHHVHQQLNQSLSNLRYRSIFFLYSRYYCNLCTAHMHTTACKHTEYDELDSVFADKNRSCVLLCDSLVHKCVFYTPFDCGTHWRDWNRPCSGRPSDDSLCNCSLCWQYIYGTAE
jgi:hypothetical protein